MGVVVQSGHGDADGNDSRATNWVPAATTAPIPPEGSALQAEWRMAVDGEPRYTKPERTPCV
jgi:hypothetical protein